MDYSKLVESLRKNESNRKCFDCGVVGTTYASLNFGTFVCSQCAGILRGLNYKVKPLGISIFTLKEYEILQKNGNDNAKNIWMALYDPYKHEKPNPKNYNDVKEHLIRKYKEKKFYRESKGIHFINKSIEDDIKDPLEFINKCKIKNIDVGPLWTKKKSEQKNDFLNNNDDKKNETMKDNKNQNNNVDLLGGLFSSDSSNNQNEINKNKQESDVNDLLGGFNFSNDNKSEKFNNMINNLSNVQPSININKDKKDNDLGFDFSSFNLGNNNQNIPSLPKKEEIQDENFGFDFGDEKQDINSNKEIKTNKNITDKAINNEGKSDLLDFDFNNNINNQNKNIDNNDNLDFFNMNKKEQNIIGFDFGDNNQNKNNKNENIFNNDLGFEFDSHMQQQKGESKEINNENINKDNFGLNFDFNNIKSEQAINKPNNINNIFEDPNTEKINDMKKNQEMKRNDNFQNLTIALDNQNQLDKMNQVNFDFGSNNIFSNDNNTKKENTDFNFEQMMNLKK